MKSSKSETVRLGVIGAGLAARLLHWPALERLRDRFTITMVASGSEDSSRSFAEMVGGCPWTLNYHDVLESDSVEAVLVTLPIHLNAQALAESVRAGKHVLCEKPIAANLEQARQVVAEVEAAAEARGLAVAIAEHFHYRQDIITAREWIRKGRLGELFLVDVTCYHYIDTTQGFASTPWRWDSQYRGGAVTDAAVHHAAFLREIGGKPEQVQAFTKLIHPRFSGMDTITLNVRFRNGALGRLLFTGGAVGVETPFLQATIFGTEGAITMDDRTVRLRTKEGKEDQFGPYDSSEAYFDQLVNFHEAITKGVPVVSTPVEALRDLELLMRAYDSAESRSVVLFP
ncbi:MAG: Gfo/Idh/MocA family oxidoreductase [Chloroflexia bacterium]